MSDRIPVKEFERHYFPKDFKPKDWKSLKPYADDLLKRHWKNADDYRQWLKDWDEFEVIYWEEGAQRYIDLSVDTENAEKKKSYNDWTTKVETKKSVVGNKLNKRSVSSPYNSIIEKEEVGFSLWIEDLKASIDLFRKANVPLIAEVTEKGLEQGRVTGARSVTIDDTKMTIQDASVLLESPDRAVREKAWHAISERRYQDKEKLDRVFGDLVKLRHQMAVNAGEENYRDYKFKELRRTTYTPQDCFDFHNAIEACVVPLAKKLSEERRQKMGFDTLRPWDYACDPSGLPAIVAFKDSKELVTKTIDIFDKISPVCGYTIRRMQENNLLDLDARTGKATNAYNFMLPETRSSFMFANQVGTVDDLTTMLHEGGHATHDVLCFGLNNLAYQNYQVEIAEVASMSMELLTLDDWGAFIPDPQECARAKYNHLAGIVKFLPYMAKVDAFQHTIYENPDLSVEERHGVWADLNERFDFADADKTGLNEDYARVSWHEKMHIFEMPFYYVEYGIAQLGALQVWRNSKQDKKAAVDNLHKGLALGRTQPLPDIFKAAGIKLDFSTNMIKDLMEFVEDEMDSLATIINPQLRP